MSEVGNAVRSNLAAGEPVASTNATCHTVQRVSARLGATMLAMESLSIVMVRESALGVHRAGRAETRWTVVQVAFVDATGSPAARFERTRSRPRSSEHGKGHVEDWVAVLVANHLFAGTDALVAALLWDLPAEVAVSGERRSTNVGLRFRF